VTLAHAAYDRRYATSATEAIHVNPEARLPPFPRLVEASFDRVMRQESTPLLVRARIWAWSPEALRERTWPVLGGMLTSQAEAAGLDAARAFPPPRGTAASPDDGEAATSEPAEGRP
jgi:hypothetical protein